MTLAEKKKLSNIAEYIIYVWQTEDLIRAYNFKIDEIEESIISFLPISDTEKKETKVWYQNLISEMIAEKIEKKGHTKTTTKLIDELFALHTSLTTIEPDPVYLDLVEKAKESVEGFKDLAGDTEFNIIEICMNGVYGLFLLRIDNKEVPDDLLSKIEHFGNIMSYLAYKYKEQHQGLWN